MCLQNKMLMVSDKVLGANDVCEHQKDYRASVLYFYDAGLNINCCY